MQRVQLELDSNVRRTSNGTALIGGSPFRVVRLSSAGSELLDRWLTGSDAPAAPAEQQLLRSLLSAGLVHPVVRADWGSSIEVTVVVPAYGEVTGLPELLRSVRRARDEIEIIVVDDGSGPTAARAIAEVADRHGATLLRHEINRGPAAARNTGWRHAAATIPTAAVVSEVDVAPGPAAARTVEAEPVVSEVDVESDTGWRHAAATILTAADRVVPEVGVEPGPAARPTAAEPVVSEADFAPAARTAAVEHVVFFVDADAELAPGALATTLAHFADVDVAVVAPRVKAMSDAGVISAYEATDSPLDQGPDPARVRPGSRISYVPSAALAVRLATLDALDGFDEQMRVGEDVDFIWRVSLSSPQTVRYEPAAVVWHRNRHDLAGFVRQRFSYGSSAAELAKRHGDTVAPLQMPWRPVVGVLAGFLGSRIGLLVGIASVAMSTRELHAKLANVVDEPLGEATRLSLRTHGYAIEGLASATTRAWVLLALPFRRTRMAWTAALALPAAIDWLRTRPRHNPLTHIALRSLDHTSYCVGVWTGAIRARSANCLLPRRSRRGLAE